MIDGAEAAKLGEYDYFGEGALLKDQPRAATIVVTPATMTVLKLTQDKFRELGLQDKLVFPGRQALGVGGLKVETKPPTPKTPADITLIREGLQKNEALSTVVTLDDARIQKLIDQSWKETVKKGTETIKEGDPNADYFYIVASGKFQVTSTDEDESAE